MPDNLTKDWILSPSDEIAVTKHGCYFDTKAVIRVLDFFRTFIRHTKAPFAGKPFIPHQWQIDRCIAPLYGWKMPDGTRRFREFEQWIPKKNGKSTMAAAMVLNAICNDDEYGAEVYSAASDRKQASIIYNEVVSMIRLSEELAESLREKEYVKKIFYDDENSIYEVLSADGYRNEGYNIHALFFDELHTQKNRNMWGALKYGGASRSQPMRCVLSTAGQLDKESLWYERFQYCIEVQAGKKIDIHLLPCVYALETDENGKPTEDWESPKIWHRVNPSLGLSLSEIQFEQDYKGALQNSANESEFKRYRLNCPTKAESEWIRNQYWINSGNEFARIKVDKTIKPVSIAVHGGADLADNFDLNAFIRAEKIEVPNLGTCLKIKPTFWACEEAGKASNQNNRDRYLKWFNTGDLKCIPGPIAEQKVIQDDILQIVKASKNPFIEIAIDKWQSPQFAYDMQKKFKANKVKTTLRLAGYNYLTTNEPVKVLEALIVSGRLLHDNNPIMNYMFGNIIATLDSSGNRKLDKGKSKGKIDGFSALIMAIISILNAERESIQTKSKYEAKNAKLGTIGLW